MYFLWGIGKTRRGAGAGAGDCLVKPGTGNPEITCCDRYYHVHIDFHHHVRIKSLISSWACVESKATYMRTGSRQYIFVK